MQPETYPSDYVRSWSDSVRQKSGVSRHTAELEQAMSLPNMTWHTSLKQRQAAIRTIKALAQGPINILSQEQIKRIRTKMSDQRGEKTYTRKQIEDFLHKKFTKEERERLYISLSRYYDPAYNATISQKQKKEKGNLGSALYGFGTGYCLLMSLWYYPPHLPRRAIINLNSDLKEVVTMIQDVIQDHSHDTKATLSRIIVPLERYFRQVLRPGMSDEQRYHYGTFHAFMSGYINFLNDNYDLFRKKPSAGWFRSDTKMLTAWWKEIDDQTDY